MSFHRGVVVELRSPASRRPLPSDADYLLLTSTDEFRELRCSDATHHRLEGHHGPDGRTFDIC